DGARRIYAVDPAPLREVDRWLAPYRAVWSRRLDALERRLDAMAAAETADRRANDDEPDSNTDTDTEEERR
ncbi:MAG TPA: transcriptional regulator, partial [Nocardioides sp.]